MIILLPPSSGKTAPTSGTSLALDTLFWNTELHTCREELISALIKTCTSPHAARILKLGPNTISDIADNVDLLSAPTAPAIDLYTGVLYDAASFENTLEKSSNSSSSLQQAHQILNSEIYLFSGLWGVIRPKDHIPNYRLCASTKLSSIGTVSTYWKKHLTTLCSMRFKNELIVDCRSGEYRKMWTPNAKSPIEVLQVVVKKEHPQTHKRSVVSHNAKYMRGVLAGALFARRTSNKLPKEASISQIVEIASKLPKVIDVELSAPKINGEYTLTIITQA